MSLYQRITDSLSKYIPVHVVLRHGFNLSPMYRRSTGRVEYLSPDMHVARIRIRLSLKNRNFVGSIFGGSMYSATDPIYMIQLMQILGKDYVVWDKYSTIRYLRPARETLYAEFRFTPEEIEHIKQKVAEQKSLDYTKELVLTNKEGDVEYCKLEKMLYIADKEFYKESRKKKSKK